MSIIVDDDTCTRCGICSAVCPMGIIKPSDGTVMPVVPDENTEMCINCGQCDAFCPTGALTRNQAIGAEREKAWDGKEITPANISVYLKSRRSIRNFKPDPVPRETIESLLDIARYAASGGNGQPVEWLVIHDPEETKKIAGLTIDWMKILVNSSHPMSGYVPGMINAWTQGIDVICRGAPHLLVPHIPEGNPMAPGDAMIALTHFDISAPAYGIGTCWGGFVAMASRSHEPLLEAFHLPEGRIPAYAMMFGFPRYQPSYIPERKPLRITWK